MKSGAEHPHRNMLELGEMEVRRWLRGGERGPLKR